MRSRLLGIVQLALLDSRKVPYSALVVSSLEKINRATDSSRLVLALPVPPKLEPGDVLSQWWLLDRSGHPLRTPR